MRDSSSQGVSNEASNSDAPSAGDGLTELRRLLFGREQAQLVNLQERLDDPELHAEDVSRILPEAIALRSGRDQQLTKTLLPTVEEAIKISVKKDSQILVDALFPVMGPAIRKAVTSTLRGMIESLNQILERSFSLQSIKWRLEALRTGKSFAEVVLLHSLVYRVEQIFLIHKETGLLLQHVVAQSAILKDADMVSGMLTAIEDFVHDSFSTPTDDELDLLQVGDLTVWIEQGPQAILAAVIRGNALQELGSIFQDALENIHLRQGENLHAFQGDASAFEASRPDLEDCLRAQYQSDRRRTSPLAWLFLGAILIALGLWLMFSIRANWRWTDYLEKLRAEPGIVVTAVEKRAGKYFVFGLRDPLASDPIKVLEETGLDPEDVISQWEPYQALSPRFILARAESLLHPPHTVSLKVDNSTLSAAGSAPHQWIVEARKLAPALPGVTQLGEENLIDEELRALVLRKERIEKRVIRFVEGGTRLSPGQNDVLDALAAEIREFTRQATSVGREIRLQIIGRTDGTGSEATNVRLSQRRADTVRSALISKGLSPASLKAVGRGTRDPLRQELTPEDRAFNRSVSVKIALSEAAGK